MRDNGVPTTHVNVFPEGKSPISLAFLDEQGNADYQFYKNYPNQRLEVDFPPLKEDDIVMLGSYYALNPVLRGKVSELLETARRQKAIVYYDPNFRAPHREEAIRLAPTIIENLEYADIVRGSSEDFFYMYGLRDADRIYKEKIKFYCPNFLCTQGEGRISLRTRSVSKDYDTPHIQTVSTVGAGDNFNAGIVCGLLTEGIRHDALSDITPEAWDRIVKTATEFAADVCQGYDNSVSLSFAASHRYQEPPMSQHTDAPAGKP